MAAFKRPSAVVPARKIIQCLVGTTPMHESENTTIAPPDIAYLQNRRAPRLEFPQHYLLQLFGGDEATIPIRQDALTMGIDTNLVFQGRALVALAQMFCAGETVAVPLFHAMRAGAEEPKVIACLDRIEKDEAGHRAFGWTTLDELLEIYGPVAHDLVQHHVQRIVDGICAAYDSSDERLTDTQRAWGLLSGVDHRRISLACARDVIVPRFRQRGFEVDMPAAPAA